MQPQGGVLVLNYTVVIPDASILNSYIQSWVDRRLCIFDEGNFTFNQQTKTFVFVWRLLSTIRRILRHFTTRTIGRSLFKRDLIFWSYATC